MTRDDIIRMAREAGFHVEDDDYGNPMLVTDSGDLIKFAQLVAAHEREECAQIADYAHRWIGDWEAKYGSASVSEAIRDRK